VTVNDQQMIRNSTIMMTTKQTEREEKKTATRIADCAGQLYFVLLQRRSSNLLSVN